MVDSHKNKLMLRIELILWATGAVCAAICLAAVFEMSISLKASEVFAQRGGVRGASQQLMPRVKIDSGAEGSVSGQVIGQLEIRQIGLKVPIVSDYEATSLLKGVGHIPGTALLGGLGTVGLAGHRDTYFRPLRNIKPNMEIRVSDQSGTYHYQVDTTAVVTPQQVEVLEIRSRPELVLITCYPFYFVGPAPKRFIVYAHLISASPDATP